MVTYSHIHPHTIRQSHTDQTIHSTSHTRTHSFSEGTVIHSYPCTNSHTHATTTVTIVTCAVVPTGGGRLHMVTHTISESYTHTETVTANCAQTHIHI